MRRPPILKLEEALTHTEDQADITIWEHHPVTKPITIISLSEDMAGASFKLSDTHADNGLFSIDGQGQIWWLAAPDYENPADEDRDNTYSVEVLVIKDGITVTKQINIVVSDIGSGRVGYDAVDQPDGNAEIYYYDRSYIPPAEQPNGLATYLLKTSAFRMPSKGPLILTWSLGSSIFAASLIRPWLDKAFAIFEAVAHIKFIEIEQYADTVQKADIEISFIQPEPDSTLRGQAIRFNNDKSILFYLSTITMVENEFNVLLHEIGHTLGLKHPFEEDAKGLWPGDEAHRYNMLSIMSYYFPEKGASRLQQADIDALQFLYGASGQQGQSAERFMPFQPIQHLIIYVLENLSSELTLFSFASLNTVDYSTIEDGSILTRITYELLDERDADYFTVDMATGKLKLSQTLSFDNPLDTWGGGYYIGNNVYELRVKITHYFEDADGSPLSSQDFYLHLAVTILEQVTLDTGDSDIDLSTSILGKYIIGSDGNNVIHDTIHPDIIDAGKGDDLIYLDSSPFDSNKIFYQIGNRQAIDGADVIFGFSRGNGNEAGDLFVFSLTRGAETNTITNYQEFLKYINKGTETLDDDEFMVQLQVSIDDEGATQIDGLLFHFAGSSTYLDGRVSIPLMKIIFADPIDTDSITEIFKDDEGNMIKPMEILDRDLFMTDLDYLDDLMGSPNSIGYIVVSETV